MMKTRILRVMSAVLVTVGIFAVTRVAAADPGRFQLALDLDAVLPQSDPSLDSGGGGMLRFGKQFGAGIADLTPEVGVGYTAFDGPGDPTVFRGAVGARLRLGKVLQPGVYGHIGFGTLSVDNVEPVADDSRTALSYDAGILLDLTLLPL